MALTDMHTNHIILVMQTETHFSV